MFYAKITNLADSNMYWDCTFTTTEEAQAWIDKQVLKPFRNINEYWYEEKNLNQSQIDSALEMRLIETSDDVYIKEYKLAAQASYTITDITAEVAAEALVVSERNVTVAQAKAALETIDGWTQLSDMNINFLKKFFTVLINDLETRPY